MSYQNDPIFAQNAAATLDSYGKVVESRRKAQDAHDRAVRERGMFQFENKQLREALADVLRHCHYPHGGIGGAFDDDTVSREKKMLFIAAVDRANQLLARVVPPTETKEKL